MSEEKHFVTGEHPTVVHDTGPVSTWVSEVVADVHMHRVVYDALIHHRPASLAGRGIRIHAANTRWAVDLLTVTLGAVIAADYVQGVLA